MILAWQGDKVEIFKKAVFILFFSFILTSLGACSSMMLVTTEKSKFDDSETIAMKDILISNPMSQPRVMLGLHWDESMPRDKNLAIIVINTDYAVGADSFFSINADGKKYKLTPIDNKSASKFYVESNGRGTIESNTVDYTTIYYYIPDNALFDISKSNEALFQIKFKKGNKVENDFGGLEKSVLRTFTTVKNKTLAKKNLPNT